MIDKATEANQLVREKDHNIKQLEEQLRVEKTKE